MSMSQGLSRDGACPRLGVSVRNGGVPADVPSLRERLRGEGWDGGVHIFSRGFHVRKIRNVWCKSLSTCISVLSLGGKFIGLLHGFVREKKKKEVSVP